MKRLQPADDMLHDDTPTAPLTGSPRSAVTFTLCVIVATVFMLASMTSPDLSPAGQRALFILTLAAGLWVTETVPPFAVGILVIGLNIALLGRPGDVYAKSETDWEQFVLVMGHPLIWLFFGGLVMAAGMTQVGLDRWFAGALIRRIGQRPGAILAGVMAVTFVLSMFMSNTSTVAVMLALLAPLLASARAGDPVPRALLLGIAAAANLGGMGSLIGTPPNAIAVGALAPIAGAPKITFFDWMLLGLPPAAVAAFGVWFYLVAKMPREPLPDFLGSHRSSAPAWQMPVVALTLLVTIGLWLSNSLHQVPTAAVALLPIVVLTTTGILGVREFRGLSYDVLFLMAGGLALGKVVVDTGLSAWLVSRLPLAEQPPMVIALVLCYATVLISNFMSNTAAANLVMPIAIGISAGSEALSALGVALGASAAMCLPVSTPPNAMVFATEHCRTSDFVRLGLAIGLLLPPMGLAWFYLLLRAGVL